MPAAPSDGPAERAPETPANICGPSRSRARRSGCMAMPPRSPIAATAATPLNRVRRSCARIHRSMREKRAKGALVHRGGSEPLRALEVDVEQQADDHDQADREGVAVGPLQLGHDVEVHAVDAA